MTGATAGIGYATVKLLSDKGCKVIIHGRNEKSARAACKRLNISRAAVPVWGDLRDLRKVYRLAKQIKEVSASLDVVVLNAGVFQKGGLRSADGLELDFVVNYLSQLLLVHLLLPQLLAARHSRIIFVSSSAYINGKVDIDNLGKQHVHDPITAYATSKQLCLMAALEVSRRLSKTTVCVNACNPGPTCTKLLAAGKNHGWRNSGSSPVKAANRLEWLALSPELRTVSGHYFNGRSTPNVPERIRNAETIAAVYEASTRICRISPLFPEKSAAR